MYLCSFVDGVVLDCNVVALEEIKSMSSYLGIEMFVSKGGQVKKTIDCFTWIGNVQLFNVDDAALTRDVDRIREIESRSELLILE